MNSENQSIGCKQPLNRYLRVLILTLVLSLTLSTSCTTRRLIENRKSTTDNHQTLKSSNQSSIINHQSLIDSIHVITNETIWTPPDTLGNQYPLKTTIRESGSQRKTLTDRVEQRRDTIYIESSTINHQSSNSDIRAPTNTWIPWLIIVGMVIVALIIIAIRIFLIKL